MSTPEIRALQVRVASHDETLRAISDTAIAIQTTVEDHTRRLDGIDTRLDGIDTRLDSHGEMLRELLRRLPPPS